MLLPKLLVTTASDQATCLIRAHLLNGAILRIKRAKVRFVRIVVRKVQEIPLAMHIQGPHEIHGPELHGPRGTTLTVRTSNGGDRWLVYI